MPHGDLQLYLEGALNIKNTALLGKCSPYCILTVGAQSYKSNVAADGGSKPFWGQTFNYKIDRSTNDLMIQIKAKNALRDDDAIGEAHLSFAEVFREGHTVDVTSYPVTRGGKQHGSIRLGLRFFAKKRPAHVEPSPGPLFEVNRRPVLSPIPSVDRVPPIDDAEDDSSSSRKSRFEEEANVYEEATPTPRRSRQPSHESDHRSDRRRSMPANLHPLQHPTLQHPQSVPTSAHVQQQLLSPPAAPPFHGGQRRLVAQEEHAPLSPPRRHPVPDPRGIPTGPPSRDGSSREGSGRGGRSEHGGFENSIPPRGFVGSAFRPRGPAPNFDGRNQIPVAQTHLSTPNQVRPILPTRPPAPVDYAFADIPPLSDDLSPATMSKLPQIPTISTIPSVEIHDSSIHEEPIQSAYPEPAASAPKNMAPPPSDAAKVGPQLSEDDKPLYVSMRNRPRAREAENVKREQSGSPSHGQSGRAERDSDAGSEGSLHSRRSSLSQDPIISKLPRPPGEMADKDLRKSDSDAESVGSRHSRRPSFSQDPNASRMPRPSEPANFELENRGRGQIVEAPHVEAALWNNANYGQYRNNSPRPLNPNVGPRPPPGQPMQMRPNANARFRPGNLSPTANQIRPPGGFVVRSQLPPQRGPANSFRPPQLQPQVQPRPGLRPIHNSLPYPTGSPEYRPVRSNEPGNVQGQARSIPKQPQPGQAPVVELQRKAAEQAARFGRNENGEPLQHALVMLEHPRAPGETRYQQQSMQDCDSDTESEGSRKSRKSNISKGSSKSRKSNISKGSSKSRKSNISKGSSKSGTSIAPTRVGPPMPPPSSRLPNQRPAPHHAPQRRPQPVAQPTFAPEKGESSEEEEGAQLGGGVPLSLGVQIHNGESDSEEDAPVQQSTGPLVQQNDDSGGNYQVEASVSASHSVSVEQTVTVERTVSVEQNISIERSVEVETSHKESVEVEASCEVDQNVEVETSYKVEQSVEVETSYEESVEVEESYEVEQNVEVETLCEVEQSVEMGSASYEVEQSAEVDTSYEVEQIVEVETSYKESVEMEASYEAEQSIKVETSYEVEHSAEVDASYEVEQSFEVETSYKESVEMEASYEAEQSAEVDTSYEVEQSFEVETYHEVEQSAEVYTSYEVERSVEVEASHEVEQSVEVEASYEIEQNAEVVTSYEIEASYGQDVEVEASYDVETSYEQNVEVETSYKKYYETRVSYQENVEVEAPYEENWEAEVGIEASHGENYESEVSYKNTLEVETSSESSNAVEASYDANVAAAHRVQSPQPGYRGMGANYGEAQNDRVSNWLQDTDAAEAAPYEAVSEQARPARRVRSKQPPAYDYDPSNDDCSYDDNQAYPQQRPVRNSAPAYDANYYPEQASNQGYSQPNQPLQAIPVDSSSAVKKASKNVNNSWKMLKKGMANVGRTFTPVMAPIGAAIVGEATKQTLHAFANPNAVNSGASTAGLENLLATAAVGAVLAAASPQGRGQMMRPGYGGGMGGTGMLPPPPGAGRASVGAPAPRPMPGGPPPMGGPPRGPQMAGPYPGPPTGPMGMRPRGPPMGGPSGGPPMGMRPRGPPMGGPPRGPPTGGPPRGPPTGGPPRGPPTGGPPRGPPMGGPPRGPRMGGPPRGPPMGGPPRGPPMGGFPRGPPMGGPPRGSPMGGPPRGPLPSTRDPPGSALQAYG